MYLSPELASEEIASGSFGCVFRPHIKCNSAVNNVHIRSLLESKPYITKLMLKKHADEEMDEIKKILPIIKTIPNYKKYFLLDDIFLSYDFGPLNSDELKTYRNCKNLIASGISPETVNSKLDKLGAIYIPDGGKALSTLFSELGKSIIIPNNYKGGSQQNKDLPNKTSSSFIKFGLVSWGLIDLLKYAIFPMNKKNLYNFDVKSENMLIDPSILNTIPHRMPHIKLIDWGLGQVLTSHPVNINERPIHFNLPFSNILINYKIDDIIKRFFVSLNIDNLGVLPYGSIKGLSAFIISSVAADIGDGHINWLYDYLKPISEKLNISPLDPSNQYAFDKFNISETCFKNNSLFYSYFIDYISKVLAKYLVVENKEIKFDRERYINEVYKHNVDIWGFLTVYQDLIISMNRLNLLYVRISNLLFKYVYNSDYAIQKIPVEKLIKELEFISKTIVTKPKDITFSSEAPLQTTSFSPVVQAPIVIPAAINSKTQKKKPSPKNPGFMESIYSNLSNSLGTNTQAPPKSKPEAKLISKTPAQLYKSKEIRDIPADIKVRKLKSTRKLCPRGWRKYNYLVDGAGYGKHCYKKI